MKQLFFVFFLLTTLQVCGQKYLVLLKDKNGSTFSIDKPQAFLSQRAIERRSRQRIAIGQHDLPVSPDYVAQIRRTGARVWYTSRWFNAVLVEANAAQLRAIQNLPFYKGIEFGRALQGARVSAERVANNKFGTDELNYGTSQAQIQMLGIDKMHEQGYRGEGMLIGILDSGFQNSDKNTALTPLFTDKRIVSTYDFVRNETSIFEDHWHGNNVFSIMASYREGAIIGPAYRASYVLLRTEEDKSESRLEEANWLFGAEYADSIGVDVINSSLGYYSFDNSADDYTYANMNGRTTLAARAAGWAARVGMAVVVSAGNEGNTAWRFIATPADADSVLAVGAVASNRTLAAFSSIGPSADGRVKPDVCAQGAATVYSSASNTVLTGNGTSYSAPLIAGFVAGLWQAFPSLTAVQVLDCVRKAGHLYSTPNAQFGYGIPTFDKAVEEARRAAGITSVAPIEIASSQVAPNPFSQAPVLSVPTQLMGKQLTMSLIDLTGKLYWTNAVRVNNAQMSLSFAENLPAGLYFLKLSSDNRTETLKIVKQP
jgi:serine protease AprX